MDNGVVQVALAETTLETTVFVKKFMNASWYRKPVKLLG